MCRSELIRRVLVGLKPDLQAGSSRDVPRSIHASPPLRSAGERGRVQGGGTSAYQRGAVRVIGPPRVLAGVRWKRRPPRRAPPALAAAATPPSPQRGRTLSSASC